MGEAAFSKTAFLDQLLKTVQLLFHASGAAIYLSEEGAAPFRLFRRRGFRDFPQELDLQGGECSLRESLRGKSCTSRGPGETASPILLTVPLVLRQEVKGFLSLALKEKGRRLWDEEFGRSLGSLVAVFMENYDLYEQSRQESQVIRSLYRSNLQFALSLDLKETLEKIIDSLREIVPCEAVAIYLLDTQTNQLSALSYRGFTKKHYEKLKLRLGHGLVGHVAETKKPFLSGDVQNDPHYVEARKQTRSEVVIPLLSGGKLIGALNLESNRKDAFSQKQIMVLQIFSSLAAIALERSRLHDSILEKQKIERDLVIAREIQKLLLPDRSPKQEGFEIWGRSISAERVGGDFYDFLSSPEGATTFVIADVMGKGIPAAMIVSLLKSAFLLTFRQPGSLMEKVASINSFLTENAKVPQYISCIFGSVDERELTYINCGHPYPLLLRREKVYTLRKGNTLLGLFPDQEFQEVRIPLQRGDQFLFYTDGLSETRTPQERELGIEGVRRLLKSLPPLSPSKKWNYLLTQTEAFAAGAPRTDDLTVIFMKKEK